MAGASSAAVSAVPGLVIYRDEVWVPPAVVPTQMPLACVVHTQVHVLDRFSSGDAIGPSIDALQRDPERDLPAASVVAVMGSPLVVSVDNRRVYIYREAGRDSIPVRIVGRMASSRLDALARGHVTQLAKYFLLESDLRPQHQPKHRITKLTVHKGRTITARCRPPGPQGSHTGPLRLGPDASRASALYPTSKGRASCPFR